MLGAPAVYAEIEFLPISALQHWVYCERQCALIHLEREWGENRYTAEGRDMHRRAHAATHEQRPGVLIQRAVPVSSEALGLTGICDVVEIHRDGLLVPIEYKRGRPKAHDADEVQVAAQAMCLEEMMGNSIAEAQLYYRRIGRRCTVLIDDGLRRRVTELAAVVHASIEAGATPTAQYRPDRCDPCSLLAVCEPKAMTVPSSMRDRLMSSLTDH
jgi:CRISPR-associated exonuclease Cas4